MQMSVYTYVFSNLKSTVSGKKGIIHGDKARASANKKKTAPNWMEYKTTHTSINCAKWEIKNDEDKTRRRRMKANKILQVNVSLIFPQRMWVESRGSA